jgi:mycothiol synthase
MEIRAFTEKDIDNVVSIFNEACKYDRDFSPLSERTWREWFSGPDVRLERDCFVAGEEEIWGFGSLHIHSEALRVGRMYLSGPYVHPKFERRGAGKALLDVLLAEAGRRGANQILVSIPEERSSHGFVKKFGFRVVRYFLRLRAEVRDIPHIAKPEDILVRTFEEGDEGMLLDIHNRGFIDHWNFFPMTMDDINQWKKEFLFDPQGIFLAIHNGRTEGFCVVFIDEEHVNYTGDKVAYVGDLACDKGYRRRGIGSHLLYLAGEYAKGKGMTALELDMDAENPNAPSVYEKMGFVQKRQSISYRREV